jgi:hypothetical protein
MPGYLEAYGSGEEKRAKLIKRISLVLVLVLAAAGGVYYFFRNYRETRQAELFFDLLRAKDYKAAYALWGCTEATPCPHYTMNKFMEDWGPKSDYADPSSFEITKTRGCSSGVIIEANFGRGLREYLWVERGSRQLGYAPQYVEGVMPVCNPVYRPGGP